MRLLESSSDMEANPPLTVQDSRTIYWRRVQRLTLQLLLAWFAVTFLVIFFAREISTINFFGWPLSFYMAAQGIVLVYLLIVGFYAWSMKRLDRILKGRTADAQ